jgi:hypothetical protein
MESFPAGVPAPGANRLVPQGMGIVPSALRHAGVAQRQERQSSKLEMTGSSPAVRSKFAAFV